MEIRKILFPVDLTGFSFKIVPQLLFFAHEFHAEIHLLFVEGTMKEYSTFFVPHPSLDVIETESAKRAEKKLEEFAQEYLADYPKITKMVLRGHPVKEITKYCDSVGIDMIVMASHGRHGLQRVLFGSVADEIVQKSSVPVVCINPETEAEKKKEEFFPYGRTAGESGRSEARI